MAGLFFLAALGMRGAIKGAGAVKNYKERNTYSHTYPLGKYTNDRYYYDYNNHTRLVRTNQQIFFVNGRYVDDHYNVIYDESAEERKHLQKNADSKTAASEITIEFKYNPVIHNLYPFIYEKKTGKMIVELCRDGDYHSSHYGIRYWDGYTKCEGWTDTKIQEIPKEYYEKLKNDIRDLPEETFGTFTGIRTKYTVKMRDNKCMAEDWNYMK